MLSNLPTNPLLASQRPYPIFVVYDAQKWWPLLLVPVLRSLLSPGNAAEILRASLWDLAVGLVLIGYSTAKWLTARYRFDRGLQLSQGLICRRQLWLLPDDAASIEVECTPLMWLTRGRRVRVNTAGLRRRSDAILYLSAERVKKLIPRPHARPPIRYAARIWPVLVLGASGSNVAFGLLTLSPAISHAGRVIGHQWGGEAAGRLGRLLMMGLPPLLEQMAGLFVWGWLLAFVYTTLRYGGFHAEREGNRLHLSSGLLTRRDVFINSRKVTALELRQTLFMKLFSLYTVTITAAGYGREKGTRPVVVPAAGKRELCSALDQLLPDYPVCSSFLRPRRRSFFRYLWLPLAVLAGAAVLNLMGGFYRPIGMVLLVMGAWQLLVRSIGFRQAGFGVGRGAVAVRYPRGLALYEVHIPLETADTIVIRQSWLQRKRNLCTVEVRCFYEQPGRFRRRRHRVYCLPYDAALHTLKKCREYQS